MDGIINENGFRQFVNDLRSGNLNGIVVYIHRLTQDPVALASDANLRYIFQAVTTDGQLDLHFPKDEDLEIVYSIPKRILLAITQTDEGAQALKNNPGLAEILADYDLMRDCIFCSNAISDASFEQKLIDISQESPHFLGV